MKGTGRRFGWVRGAREPEEEGNRELEQRKHFCFLGLEKVDRDRKAGFAREY